MDDRLLELFPAGAHGDGSCRYLDTLPISLFTHASLPSEVMIVQTAPSIVVVEAWTGCRNQLKAKVGQGLELVASDSGDGRCVKIDCSRGSGMS